MKLCSMAVNTDDLEKYYISERFAQRYCENKVDDDFRATKLWAFLRSSRIQSSTVHNAFLGQMRTIGSCIVMAEEAKFYSEGKVFIPFMYFGIAWDIIEAKPKAGEIVSVARILSVFEDSRTIRAVTA